MKQASAENHTKEKKEQKIKMQTTSYFKTCLKHKKTFEDKYLNITKTVNKN